MLFICLKCQQPTRASWQRPDGFPIHVPLPHAPLLPLGKGELRKAEKHLVSPALALYWILGTTYILLNLLWKVQFESRFQMYSFLLIKSSQEKKNLHKKSLKSQKMNRCKSLTVKPEWQLPWVGTLGSVACYGRLRAKGQPVLHSKSSSGIHRLCLSSIKSLVRIEIWGKSLREIIPER